MSEIDTNKLIDILQFAKVEIENQREYYVCWAIHSYHNYTKEKLYLYEWIDSMLDKRYTLDIWLLNVHGILPKVHDKNYKTKMRQTRIQWINWMINELKSGR